MKPSPQPPARHARRLTSPLLVLAALLLVALLSACGVTDKAGTNFAIVIEGADPDQTAAHIGALMLGEVGKVTFEVTPKNGSTRDRTAGATFELVNKQDDDDKSEFVFLESTDLSTQPYHTLRSDFVDAKATLCASYSGPEVVTAAPMKVCMRVITIDPDTEE